MPKRSSVSGSDLFIVDNSDEDWNVVRYLHDWCQLSRPIDIATGYFEIGGLLSLGEEWQKVDAIRILMGDQVSLRTRKAFEDALATIAGVPSTLSRLERAKHILEGLWPADWAPDWMVALQETGYRVTLHPDSAAVLLEHLRAGLEPVLDRLGALRGDTTAIRRALAHLGR